MAKKSFAKAFFEDIKEEPDATRTTKPTAMKMQTESSKAEDKMYRDKAHKLHERADTWEKEAEASSDPTFKYAAKAGADYLRKVEARDANYNTTFGRAASSERARQWLDEYDKEQSKEKASEFEQNLHKHDKNRGYSFTSELKDNIPGSLAKPKKKSFAKSFFEDIK